MYASWIGLFTVTGPSAPRWTIAAPTVHLSCVFGLIALSSMLGCAPKPHSPQEPSEHASKLKTQQNPPRPTVPPPPIKLFHQTDNSITLTTTSEATDQQVEAILWQLRDAAHNHSFDALHIPQKLVDARSPNIWFHLYRGSRCAAEKYAPGAPPCGSSYHAAGDYTLGSGIIPTGTAECSSHHQAQTSPTKRNCGRQAARTQLLAPSFLAAS